MKEAIAVERRRCRERGNGFVDAGGGSHHEQERLPPMSVLAIVLVGFFNSKFYDPDGFLVQVNAPDYTGHMS